MKKYLAEVRNALKPFEDKPRAQFLSGYLNTAIPLFGINVPPQRVISKKGFSFASLPQKQIDAIWQYIWENGKEFEVMSQCLLHYSYHDEELGLAEWKFLKHWVKRVDNWAHADSLSDLYAILHERYPKDVYSQYVKWNKSKNPWEVRASLVGLFYYARQRAKQPSFSKVMRMVNGAFRHKDVYVQKGVGWTLRECYNVYPEPTWKFLREHAKDLSAIAWQAATEKLGPQRKAELKRLRKSL